jgi:hypothetical protein
MSEDYLRYEFNQRITPELRNILKSEDLSSMVINVQIDFREKEKEKEITEEDKEVIRRNERKIKKAQFEIEWGKISSSTRRRARKGQDQKEDELQLTMEQFEGMHADIKKRKMELYDKFFPGEKEDDFLTN